jgi:hypothetical protein
MNFIQAGREMENKTGHFCFFLNVGKKFILLRVSLVITSLSKLEAKPSEIFEDVTELFIFGIIDICLHG